MHTYNLINLLSHNWCIGTFKVNVGHGLVYTIYRLPTFRVFEDISSKYIFELYLDCIENV